MTTRTIFAVAISAVAVTAYWTLGRSQVTRLDARPGAPPSTAIHAGEHQLGLGGTRDGTLYIPDRPTSQTPLPLIVLMHGAGQSKELFQFAFPLADELGVVIMTLDSRDTTWDGIRGAFGPDVMFIDSALRYTFDRVAIDPRRLAIGGFSDGASYALSLGLANGDLFTHLVALSPGFIAGAAPPIGRPRIFVSHGTQDRVLNIDRASRQLVPELKSASYDVTYREFDGPHTMPLPIAREALEWLVR